jgi:hypothetical protein
MNNKEFIYNMIVYNIGYLKLESVLELKQFSIYETHKKTQILVKNTSQEKISLYFPKEDRLPYKTVEGKKICSGTKIFDSNKDLLSSIDTSGWNNKNQIMSYEEYYR